MLKFFACVVAAHFIGAAHVEIGRWLHEVARDYDLNFLLPLAKYLRPNQESVQLTVVFTLWLFIGLVFAANNSRLQRAYEKAEAEERLHQERLEKIKDVEF